MSKVEIEIPDDRWFRGEWQIRPQDKQLCVVIDNVTGIPMIGMFLKNVRLDKYSSKREDYFFDVIQAMEFKRMFRNNTPSFISLYKVDRWKTLGLPEDVNDRILAEIEKWFEEEE